MKRKQYVLLLMACMILSLAGCAENKTPTGSDGSSKAVTTDIDPYVAADNDGSSCGLAEQTGSLNCMEINSSSQAPMEKNEEKTQESTVLSNAADKSSKPVEIEVRQTESTKRDKTVSTKPRSSSDTKSEKPEKTESVKSSESAVSEKPVESVPAKSEQQFNINDWIVYAKKYAQDFGLELDSEAVECWDTPIIAGAECKYLKRDIQSRLNRYNRDDDITTVWIWAEKRSDQKYDLYIGYA